MAAANTKTLVYSDWSKGEFGVLGADRAPDGSWTGINMVVYRDGHIGPRPGLREFVPTGVPDGELDGIGFVPTVESDQPAVWFIIGSTVYGFRPGASFLTTLTPDLDAPVPEDSFVWWKESTRQLFGNAYITNPEDKGYRLDLPAGTTEAVTDMPGGKDIETYKERMVVAENGTTATRIFFSGPADFDLWPVENFFDVGASWPVGQMMEFRDGLAIFTNSGIWLLTGTLPDSATLRRVSDALPPRNRSVVKTNEDMFYVPVARSAPVAYTGSSGAEEQLKHLEDWKAVGEDATGIMVYGNRDILFLSDGSKMLWRKNGAWTYHTFSVPVGPYMVRYFDDDAVLTDGGAEADPARFFGLTMSLDRPAFTSDGFAQPGDDSDTPVEAILTLPDFFSEDGTDVRVRSVIVDFTKYSTGSPATNHMTLLVEGLSRFRLPGVGTSIAEATWDDAGANATTTGVRERWVANLGQAGTHGGFRLTLEDIRGVKISRIFVDIETTPSRPRS